jgi:hypothetical protein
MSANSPKRHRVALAFGAVLKVARKPLASMESTLPVGADGLRTRPTLTVLA